MLLRQHFEYEQRRILREELIAGYIANADEALAIAEEFRYSDYEVTMKYVPPSPELEPGACRRTFLDAVKFNFPILIQLWAATRVLIVQFW